MKRPPHRKPSRRTVPGALRALLLAAVSCLGLGACADSQEGAGQVQKPAIVERAAIERALRQLDKWVEEAEVDRYLDAFAPDHPGVFEMLDHRLREMIGSGHALRRTSTIIGEPRLVGPRTVVRVRAELWIDDHKDAVPLEDTIYAFRADGDAAVPTFAVDTPRSTDCPARDLFTCPPCNYSIGGVAGWICVPMTRDRAQSLEAAGFYLAGTDLACDVSVRVTPDAQRTGPSSEIDPVPEAHEALRLADELAAALLQMEPKARAEIATRWWPPAHAGQEIEGLEGARVEVVTPATGKSSGAGIARFHVLRFGAMQHLLLVRGSEKAVREHGEALDALLRSFRLLELDVDAAELGARSLRHHVGGVFDGTSYRNLRHDVRMTGPDGWATQQLCGGSAFCVRWKSPAGSRVWLHAYATPPGMSCWCKTTAERWLRGVCEHMELVLDDPSTGWEPADWKPTEEGGPLLRTIRLHPAKLTPAQNERRMLLGLRENLLVVVDAIGTNADDWSAIERAFASLRL